MRPHGPDLPLQLRGFFLSTAARPVLLGIPASSILPWTLSFRLLDMSTKGKAVSAFSELLGGLELLDDGLRLSFLQLRPAQQRNVYILSSVLRRPVELTVLPLFMDSLAIPVLGESPAEAKLQYSTSRPGIGACGYRPVGVFRYPKPSPLQIYLIPQNPILRILPVVIHRRTCGRGACGDGRRPVLLEAIFIAFILGIPKVGPAQISLSVHWSFAVDRIFAGAAQAYPSHALAVATLPSAASRREWYTRKPSLAIALKLSAADSGTGSAVQRGLSSGSHRSPKLQSPGVLPPSASRLRLAKPMRHPALNSGNGKYSSGRSVRAPTLCSETLEAEFFP